MREISGHRRSTSTARAAQLPDDVLTVVEDDDAGSGSRAPSTRVSTALLPGSSLIPRSLRTSEATSPGSLTVASSTSHTPSGLSEMRDRPISTANRVLPTPPEPVERDQSVGIEEFDHVDRSRHPGRRSWTRAQPGWWGLVDSGRTSDPAPDRNGGKFDGVVADVSWKTSSGRSMSFR